VLLDLTDESSETQTAILERVGKYWSPQNIKGTYQKIRLSDLKPSAWIDHFWEQPKAKQNDALLGPHLADIEFARRTYEQLSREHGATVDGVLTSKEISALERNRKLR
jgi:hypothetical protein